MTDGVTTELRVYLGLRPGRTRSRVAVWRKGLDPDSDTAAYAPTKHTRAGVVGGVYKIEINSDGDWIGRAEFTGDHAADSVEINLADHNHRRELEREKAERAAAKSNEVTELVEHARRVASQTRTIGSRRELLRLLEEAIWRP